MHRLYGDVIKNLKYNILVTMPNADTMGGIIRNELIKYKYE